MHRLESDRKLTARTRRERAEVLSRPRTFRAEQRTEVLAIQPEALDFSYLFSGAKPNDRTAEGVAIVTISGPLEHHAGWWWDSYEAIVGRVEAAMTGEDVSAMHAIRNGWRDDFEPMTASPSRAVILRIDSPGGEAAGATWAHRRLRSLSKRYGVPLYAYADEMACSAAYELACAADDIWLPDTGTIGSIGVIATLFDRTAANEMHGFNVELITSGDQKADSHADRPITDDIRTRMQARVDDLAMTFWRVVAKARGTSPQAVASLEAGVFIGQTAVDVGIADGVCSWERFLKTVTRALETTDGASASAA